MEFTTLITSQAIFAIASAFAAEKRGGMPLVWFILGLIFGPLAFIVALTAGKRCSHCLSIIPKEATICPNCAHETS